jgi:hypothetical protein
MRPRIGNGARRGLGLLMPVAWAAFEDPTHPWGALTKLDRRELARALAWLEWHRTHKLDGAEVVLPPRKLRGRRRRQPLEQTTLPLFEPQNRQDAGRAT